MKKEVIRKSLITKLVKTHNDVSGYSLIEVLVVAVVVLLILLGLVPLFSQSMMSNLEGWNATEAISFGRTELEEKSALELDRPDLVPVGSDLEKQLEAVWNQVERRWVDPDSSEVPSLVLWQRDTRVRRYSISDLVGPPDEERAFDTPLAADIDPRFVHFREINVWVEHQKETENLGFNRGLDVTVLRSY